MTTNRPHPRQLTPENAAAFALDDVVAHYPLRPPYPEGVVERLRSAASVLEMGCGTGELSRRLAPTAERVEAVDPSGVMLAMAQSLPGGDAPNLHWTQSTAEEFGYADRYDCILTPLSLHWMDWDVVLPQFARALRPGGFLGILTACGFADAPWTNAVRALVPQYSLMTHFDEYDLVGELESRSLFRSAENLVLGPEPFRQTVEDYIGSWWSRAGFARERMGQERAAEFAERVRDAVTPFAVDGWLEGNVVAQLCTGEPTCENGAQ